MRVGSSPLYFIQGQEPMLEKFAEHLKSKEREAFTLLKEKSFLKDLEQLPAIRVALREIKDFAIPFRNGEEIVWRFLTAQEADFKDAKEHKPKVLIEKELVEKPILEVIKMNRKVNKLKKQL